MNRPSSLRLAALLPVLLLLFAGTAFAQSATHRLILNADAPKATINRHIYGHFAEHLGRGIYDGFWIKGADGQWQLNQPVVEAMRRLNPPNVRWPGGCFADIYHWKDGIGPREERPTIVNTLWGGVTEDNSFGTHEYMELVEALGAEPFIVGNVGSGTIEEMSTWWEYVNHPGKSPMADLRAENGHPEPWNVRFWGVGNESWGCGGNMTPEYYANEYKRFATYLPSYGDVRAFRIATGPAGSDYRWTEVLMREAGHMIDGIDLHHYTVVGTWANKGPATGFSEAQWMGAMKKALEIDEIITRHSAIMDQYDPRKRVWLIVGEWGMWHDVEPGTNPGFLYQQNSLRDALVAAISFNVFNNHADRVRMANIAQTINVLQAMILTEPGTNRLVLTPTYHVFEMYKGHQDAELIPVTLDAGEYTFGDDTIPALSASASIKNGRVLLTIANLDHNAQRTVDTSLRGMSFTRVSGRILTGDSIDAHNTFDEPDNVAPVAFDGARLEGDRLTITLPPKSIVALELE
jgi:alpha-N-arabinofuranosidase